METRNCQNCKENFIIESDDLSFYEKMKVPPPTFCPDCRAQRRFMWRNERTLHKRSCDSCQKQLICLYHENAPFKVYCKECWYGDAWDPLSFGMIYDPSRTFFEQYRELMSKVPRLAIWTVQCTNSEYTNQSYNNKNVYLGFAIRDSEDSLYIARAVALRNSYDNTYTHHSDGVYECLNVDKSYKSKYVEESEGIVDSAFLSNCKNCQNCIGGVNLRSASYVFFGEQLTPEEYKKTISEIDFGNRKTIDVLQEKFTELKAQAIYKCVKTTNCVNSLGDHLVNTKDCHCVFDGFDLENVRYSSWVFSSKEVMDCYGMGGSSFIYEGIGPEEVANVKFVSVTDTSNNVDYTDLCMGSSNLFGCISLRSKKYSILNKEYSKEEYESLRERIIKDMLQNPYIDSKGRIYKYGEFFPYDLAPFSYNETIAQEMYPLTKEGALSKGFSWFDDPERNYAITKKTTDSLDSIKDISETITDEVFECGHKGMCAHQCATAFKITKQEFQFYTAHSIPLPLLCHNCRHYARLEKRNPRELWHRSCMCAQDNHGHTTPCPNKFETSYAPDRPEIVYCEKCYQQEVA
jgi:hypothetical protein